MSVVYSTPVKVARMTDVKSAVDSQATPGSLVLYTSSNTVLVTLPLSLPSGAIVQSGAPGQEDVDYVITCPLNSTSVAGGTAEHASILDGADTPVVTGLTVGTSGANVVLNIVAMVAGANVQITSASIRHG